VTEAEIARVLQLIATRANARRRRRPGDLDGPFDQWFDGGAVRAGDGETIYQLGDGTRVRVADDPRLAITIELTGGITVVVEQR
jgi:hypothetical protein